MGTQCVQFRTQWLVMIVERQSKVTGIIEDSLKCYREEAKEKAKDAVKQTKLENFFTKTGPSFSKSKFVNSEIYFKISFRRTNSFPTCLVRPFISDYWGFETLSPVGVRDANKINYNIFQCNVCEIKFWKIKWLQKHLRKIHVWKKDWFFADASESILNYVIRLTFSLYNT